MRHRPRLLMPFLLGKPLQGHNTVLSAGMCRKETVIPMRVQWIDNEHMRHARIALRCIIVDPRCQTLDPGERRDKPERVDHRGRVYRLA